MVVKIVLDEIDYQIFRMTNYFTSLMRMKLMQNKHKKMWFDCDYKYLRKRINDELKELDEAIQNKDYENVKLECADIANFCAMITDNIQYNRFKE